MPLPVWLCGVFLILVLTLGVLHIFRSVRAFWREVKSFTSAVDRTVGGVTEALERLAERNTAFGAGFPRLEAALAGFGASRRRFAVLRAALQDAQDSVGRVTAFYPHK